MTPDPRNLALMNFPFLSGILPPDTAAAVDTRAMTIAAAAFSFPSSDVNGDACARAEALEVADTAASLPHSAEVACGTSEAFRIPPGFVLVERELLGRVVKRLRQAAERERQELLEPLPTFLRERPLRDIADGMMKRPYSR